jgi:hypothetical protein
MSANLEKGQEDGYVVAGNPASTKIGCGEVWKHPLVHSAALMEDTRKLCWQEGIRVAQKVLKLTRRRAADCTAGETLEDVGYHWNPGLGNDRKRRWSWSNRLHCSRMWGTSGSKRQLFHVRDCCGKMLTAHLVAVFVTYTYDTQICHETT